ncbi:C-C motif chemokine 2-like [Xiphophorus maculatus]|uniref:C-C motif chemokine 2-like n=1 Tax=Xiphophorus maculatus TaxID=8083 RepID=A0A3B5PYZ1_XIPMA|nr:C-C motif chemokine 2-like [Xiphophorus maculatus]
MQMKWWSLKWLQAQASYHITSICPGENTMTSIPIISLVLVAVMVPTASAQGGISTCCMKFSGTKVHREMLRSYYQEDKSSCSLQAVVFTTVMGKRICASPFNMWTKTSMAFLDGKNFGQRQSGLNKQPNRTGRH